jgi:hypothetical protein
MGHPENESDYLVLEIDGSLVPRWIRPYVDLLSVGLKARLRRVAESAGMAPGEECEVTLLEEARVKIACGGGCAHTMTMPAQTRLALRGGGGRPGPDFAFRLGTHNGREVAFLAARGKTRIPVFAGKGALTPIVIGGAVSTDAPRGRYSLSAVQRDADGQVSGGYEIELRVGEQRE